MKLLHALAVSIALLVAFWVYVAVGNGLGNFGFIPWIGFVAWAAFFAAGGGKDGFLKPLQSGLAGILLTSLCMYGVAQAGGGLTAAIVLIAILAAVLVLIADIGIFSYTPAAFLGAASFFGSMKPDGDLTLYVVTSWIAGLILGYVSEALGKKMTKA